MLSSRNTGRPQPLSATSPPPGTSQKHVQCRISRERIATSNLDDLRCRQERLAVMRNSAFPCDVLGGGTSQKLFAATSIARRQHVHILGSPTLQIPCKKDCTNLATTFQQLCTNLVKTEQQPCTRLAKPSNILAITLQTPCKLFVENPATTV